MNRLGKPTSTQVRLAEIDTIFETPSWALSLREPFRKREIRMRE